MLKKTIITSSILTSSLFVSSAIAQQQIYNTNNLNNNSKIELKDKCNSVTDKENYMLLIAATKLDDISTAKFFLKNYCYELDFFKKNDLETLPIYEARSLEITKLLTEHFDFNGSTNTYLKFNPLLSHYIKPILLIDKTLQEKEIKEMKELYAKLQIQFPYKDNDETLVSKLTAKTLEDKEKIFNFLLEKDIQQQKQTKKFYTHYEKNGLELLHYVIHSNDSKTLERLLKEPQYNISKKIRLVNGNNSISPISLVFNMKKTNTIGEDSTIKINDLILEEIKNSKLFLRQRNLYGNNFFQFAHIMRENNPDFYVKLKTMFPNENYNPENSQQTKDKFLKESNLFEKAKIFIKY